LYFSIATVLLTVLPLFNVPLCIFQIYSLKLFSCISNVLLTYSNLWYFRGVLWLENTIKKFSQGFKSGELRRYGIAGISVSPLYERRPEHRLFNGSPVFFETFEPVKNHKVTIVLKSWFYQLKNLRNIFISIKTKLNTHTLFHHVFYGKIVTLYDTSQFTRALSSISDDNLNFILK